MSLADHVNEPNGAAVPIYEPYSAYQSQLLLSAGQYFFFRGPAHRETAATVVTDDDGLSNSTFSQEISTSTVRRLSRWNLLAYIPTLHELDASAVGMTALEVYHSAGRC